MSPAAGSAARPAPTAQAPAPSPIAALEFREAMSRLGAAATVVTTDGPAGRFGITASAVCSVTDAPPTLLVCINRATRLHDAVLANGTLCVNLLGRDHEALALRFARRGTTTEERFAGETWRPLVTGAPALASAIVAFDCRVAACREVGTHGVIFAEVAGLVFTEKAESLVYFDRAFHALGAVAPAP